MKRLSNSVVVSNGIGRFHVYRSAQAAEQESLLKHFITSFCITRNWQSRLLHSAFAKTLFGENRCKKGLMRNYDIIPADKIVSMIWPELYFEFGHIFKKHREFISTKTLLMYGKSSIPYIKGSKIFHVRSGFGNCAIGYAKNAGITCVVDHSIAAPTYLKYLADTIFSQWYSTDKVPSQDRLDSFWDVVTQDIKMADVIIANSSFVKDTLVTYERILSSKIRVIPMGVETEIFKPADGTINDSKPFIILFVGSISLRKGIPYLLEAFKRLSLPNAKLILVGAMGDASDLVKKCLDLVEYIPHMPQTDLVKLYQSANIFVFPSLAEGSALVTYEALASGLPVITTPESGSVVRDGIDGFIVPSMNIELLMAKISYLYSNQKIAREMGLEARRNVKENYTWEHYNKNILNVYKSISSN